MLRACRRVLRPGGRLGFFTIFPADGLSRADYRRALGSGPNAASTHRRDHKVMLAAAGFRKVEETDLTAEFLETTRAWYKGRDRRENQLRAEWGDAEFEERQADSRAQLSAIEDGLLRRALFIAW